MSFVNGFDHDIFLSYARVDNNLVNRSGKETRWVTYFKEQLQMRIDQTGPGRIGKTKIWFDDDDLGGHQSIARTIDTAIHQTAALVVILSRGYLASEWCRTEVKAFAAAAKDEDRLFVVRIADIPFEELPPELQGVIGFNFLDKRLGAELDPSGPEFGVAVLKLRDGLERRFKQITIASAGEPGAGKSAAPAAGRNDAAAPVPTVISGAAPSVPPKSETAAKAVFLAEGHDDLDERRDELKTYIAKLGYEVLPAKLYPRGAADFRAALEQDLAKCKLFVQLLGQAGTRRTEDLPAGYEGLQLEGAKAAAIPLFRAYQRGTVNFATVKHPSHRAMLEAHDVMALDLEEFKVAIKDKLAELALREAKPAAPEAGDRPILIHAIEDDMGAAFQIRDRLAAENLPFEIVDEQEPIEELAKIRDYAGLVLVYGEKAPGKWIKERMTKLMELRLAKKPLEPACALYFEPPAQRGQMRVSLPKFFCAIDRGGPGPEFEKFIGGVKGTAQKS